MLNRRSLITGLISFAVTAPAIVRAASLMPVKMFEPAFDPEQYTATLINQIYQNSRFGKFASCNRVWIRYEDCIKIFPIPDEDFYK